MFTNLPRGFIELDALRKISVLLLLVLLMKEELLNDFLVVTCTFNVAATGEAFFCAVLFGDDSMVILLADELISNGIGRLLSSTPILSWLNSVNHTLLLSLGSPDRVSAFAMQCLQICA